MRAGFRKFSKKKFMHRARGARSPAIDSLPHRAPTEITLIFCTEFYYHANISTNGNTRSLEKFLYEILYHPEFVQFDLDRKIMRHLLDPTIKTFDQSACRRGEFLCAGTRVRLYPNIKKICILLIHARFGRIQFCA